MASDHRHIKITERVSTRLKLKQLRLLVAISRHSSILHAAHELNISQPAATKLIQDLEADFGVTLHREIAAACTKYASRLEIRAP